MIMKRFLITTISMLLLCSLCSCSLIDDITRSDRMLHIYLGMFDRVMAYENEADGFASLSHEEQVFYAVWEYHAEIENGGLCQYLYNTQGAYVTQICGYLSEVGANEHREAFEQFLVDNNIDAEELMQICRDPNMTYEALYNRFSYDAVDDKFMFMRSIDWYLERYWASNGKH